MQKFLILGHINFTNEQVECKPINNLLQKVIKPIDKLPASDFLANKLINNIQNTIHGNNLGNPSQTSPQHHQ